MLRTPRAPYNSEGSPIRPVEFVRRRIRATHAMVTAFDSHAQTNRRINRAGGPYRKSWGHLQSRPFLKQPHDATLRQPSRVRQRVRVSVHGYSAGPCGRRSATGYPSESYILRWLDRNGKLGVQSSGSRETLPLTVFDHCATEDLLCHHNA